MPHARFPDFFLHSRAMTPAPKLGAQTDVCGATHLTCATLKKDPIPIMVLG
jgi:hypothetical protein